jgi:ribosome-binding factor A
MQIERVNELLLEELANAINKEVGLPDALITVSFVDCDPDLKSARVGISVLPDRLAGTALRVLKSSTSQLTGLIKNRVKLRRIPRLIWEFDATEREAEKIEKLIEEID